MRFKTWIERDQIDLYHGTTTGKEDERLKSFQQQGIKPKSSGGYGQGAGYYAYSGKDQAKAHSQSLLGQDGPKTFQQHSGNPMVVTHKAELNPKDYELDKEVQGQDLANFFKSKQDEVSKMLKARPITVQPHETAGTFINPLTLHSMFYHPSWNAIGFWLVDPDTIDVNKAQDGKDYVSFQPNNVHDAADLNLIMNQLFTELPRLSQDYKAFSRSIMKRSSEGRASPRAWKYVGDKPITPDRLMVQSGNQWSNQIKPQ